VATAFALIGLLSATLSIEALDVASSLPKYRDNINAKWVALQRGPPGPFNLAFRNVGELINDLTKVTTATTQGPQEQEPTKVQIVSGTTGTIEVVRKSLTPLVGPVAQFAVVVVLVIFMLLEREQLRERFLRLRPCERQVGVFIPDCRFCVCCNRSGDRNALELLVVMTQRKKSDPQGSPKEWSAVERQSKALEEIDTVLKSEEPAGEKLKKIVEDHTEACDEIKEKLENHRADKVAEGLAEQGFPES
jgi:hypothetical protein